jgi:hypothetical protein
LDPKALPKVLLSRLGSTCSNRLVYNLNGAFNYLHVGWWLSTHGYSPEIRLRSRLDVFAHIAADVGDTQVLYLEFGVARGDSMRRWSQLLRNPNSHLHGFDSFLGLPHDWSLEGHERGDFSTQGEPPVVDDERVRFFAGWFDQTLPQYAWPEHDVLIVMMDADLYQSTATVLRHVRDKLVPGSYLYFDQFHHRGDELRAFAEFVEETSWEFQLVAASRELSSLAFKRIDGQGQRAASEQSGHSGQNLRQRLDELDATIRRSRPGDPPLSAGPGQRGCGSPTPPLRNLSRESPPSAGIGPDAVEKSGVRTSDDPVD